MIEWLRVMFLGKPIGETLRLCVHKWSLTKQMVDGERVFIGRRCKLCGAIREE